MQQKRETKAASEVPQAPVGEKDALLAAYAEICTSYHAIDDFRMKLLGLLPFTSLAGILLLSKDNVLSSVSKTGNELLGFAAVFGSAFTLTLFVYEVRGILRCDGLIKRGKQIEDLLRVQGQFWQCDAESSKTSGEHRLAFAKRVVRLFNTTIAACLVYSFVFSAWVFLALRYGYGLKFFGCAASAVGLGLLIGGSAYALVRRAVPA
jgi:hypothetical protein